MSIEELPLNRAVSVKSFFDYAGIHLNRFTYLVDTADVNDVDLRNFLIQFDQIVIQAIVQIQVTALVWVNHVAEILAEGGAYYDAFLPRPGVVTGDGNGANIVYSFRFTRPQTGVRGGFKRFSGVPETYTAFGRYVGAQPPAAALSAIRIALSSPIVVSGKTYTPIVVVSTFNGQPLPQLGYYVPTGTTFSGRLGTQNTRK